MTLTQLQFVTVAAVSLAVQPSLAQTITVRLLNAKTGKPLANKNVTITWLSERHVPDLVVRIGSNGLGIFNVPSGAKNFFLSEGPKDGKDPGGIAFLDCNEPHLRQVPVSEVFSAGYVPQNECSKHSAKVKPGEVVFWGEKIPWWMPNFQ